MSWKRATVYCAKCWDATWLTKLWTRCYPTRSATCSWEALARKVTVLFADIRGFTRFAEQHSPQQVVETLNLVFERLTQIVLKWEGTLDKYMGDALMAFYGAPIVHKEDALAAVTSALEMQRAFSDLQTGQTTSSEALSQLGLGIGLHTGTVVVGNVGSERLMNYTVVGDTVNVAYRLQGKAGPARF